MSAAGGLDQIEKDIMLCEQFLSSDKFAKGDFPLHCILCSPSSAGNAHLCHATEFADRGANLKFVCSGGLVRSVREA